MTRQYAVDADTSLMLSETRSEYDNLGRPWRTRELAAPGGAPNNNTDRVTETGFDQSGNTTLRRQEATTGNAETNCTFDFANRRTSMTDAEGGLTTYDHDSRGNVVFTVDPVGNETRFTFDAGGRQVEEKRYEGTTLDLRIISEYDSRENRIRETTYDAGGTPLTQKRWEYDELGRNTRRVQMADPASAVAVSLAVDRVANLTYDSGSDRVDTETTYAGDPPQPRTTGYDYDDIGRLTLTTDAEGNAEARTYTVHSQVQTRTLTEPPLEARSYTYGYDSLGRMTSELAGGPPALTTTYQNDKLGRRTRIDFCDAGAWVYVYDDAGRMTQQTDPRSQITTYTHNWRGHVLTKWLGGQLVETFDYTPLGWMTLAECDASNRVTFLHDAFGQVTSETQTVAGVNKTITYDYGQAGDRTMLGYPADVGVTLTFGHDDLGQTTSIYRGGRLLVDYDYAGRFMTDRAVRTTSATTAWVRRPVGYDAHRRKTPITNSADVGGTVTELDRCEYTYDAVDNRLTAAVTGDPAIADAVIYSYDRFDRLSAANYAGDGTYELLEYDRLGNRTVFTDRRGQFFTYAHNCVNEYTDITPGTVDPQYDAAGNLTRTETNYDLVYDYEQRLAYERRLPAPRPVGVAALGRLTPRHPTRADRGIGEARGRGRSVREWVGCRHRSFARLGERERPRSDNYPRWDARAFFETPSVRCARGSSVQGVAREANISILPNNTREKSALRVSTCGDLRLYICVVARPALAYGLVMATAPHVVVDGARIRCGGGKVRAAFGRVCCSGPIALQ